MADPIQQFDIKPLIRVGEFAGHEIALTNASAFMFLVVALAASFVLLGSRNQALVPDRFQSLVEWQLLSSPPSPIARSHPSRRAPERAP